MVCRCPVWNGALFQKSLSHATVRSVPVGAHLEINTLAIFVDPELVIVVFPKHAQRRYCGKARQMQCYN
jgi:hypothetical protein